MIKITIKGGDKEAMDVIGYSIYCHLKTKHKIRFGDCDNLAYIGIAHTEEPEIVIKVKDKKND